MLVEKVEYDVNWRKFRRGTSIFIPCLACAKVRAQLAKTLKRFKIQWLMKVTIEDGIQGLRIWRL